MCGDGGQRAALTWLQSTPVVVLVGTVFEEAAQCSTWVTARWTHLETQKVKGQMMTLCTGLQTVLIWIQITHSMRCVIPQTKNGAICLLRSISLKEKFNQSENSVIYSPLCFAAKKRWSILLKNWSSWRLISEKKIYTIFKMKFSLVLLS